MSENILDKFNKSQAATLSADKVIPDFRPGYTMSVELYVQGTSGRTQIFKGLCIARRNKGVHSSLTLRKLSVHNVYVERTFFVHLPRIKKVEVHKKGRVRRAKLYYMRNLAGKATRISKEYA